jgi:hypothetical protein
VTVVDDEGVEREELIVGLSLEFTDKFGIGVTRGTNEYSLLQTELSNLRGRGEGQEKSRLDIQELEFTEFAEAEMEFIEEYVVSRTGYKPVEIWGMADQLKAQESVWRSRVPDLILIATGDGGRVLGMN